MAAVFPLDTSKPWIFNGVTYKYDASEDRWFVVSTTATDSVVSSLDELERGLDVANSVIDQEIDNRTALLNVAAAKNNEQDASLLELSGRIDAIGANVGILEFRGRYKYVLEKSEDACNAALAEALLQGMEQVEALREHTDCMEAIGQPLEQGTFTSLGTLDQSLTEELLICNTDLDGSTFDWENLLETGDYIELVEKTQSDTVLYEVVSDPVRDGNEERIRVKYIKETGAGDGNFNLQEICELRVIKQKLGLDIVEADKRYVQRPYTVTFSNEAPEEGEGQAEDGALQNGELWYDTQNLELFVWNNNAWVTAAKPPSQDIVISSALDDISRISGEVHQVSQDLNTIDAYLQTRKNIYYSDGTPDAGSNPDGSPRSFNNGDLWIDGDDLNLKFYSQGAWVNPDRQNDSSAEIDALRGELLNAINAPAHLSWKFDNSTTSSGPDEGYMKRDSSKIWRFSFKTADGIDLGRNLIDDTDTHEWGTQMTIWEHQSSIGWKMKAHYKINKWRWNHISASAGGSAHFELEQSGVYGETLSNGRTYYVSVGGWF